MRNNTTSRLLMQQLTEGQLRWEDLDAEFDIVCISLNVICHSDFSLSDNCYPRLLWCNLPNLF